MNSLDIALFIPVAFAFIRGFRKGLIIELATFFGFIIALLVTMKLAGSMVQWLSGSFPHSRWLPFMGYLLTFILTFLLILWCGKIIEGWVNLAKLGIANKLAGAALGVIKMCFLLSMVLWLADRVNLIPEHVKTASLFYNVINGFAPKTISFISAHLPYVKGLISNTESFFDKLKPGLDTAH
jgi:membrane protein required for colicin V production